jgi:hypothetical protein
MTTQVLGVLRSADIAVTRARKPGPGSFAKRGISFFIVLSAVSHASGARAAMVVADATVGLDTAVGVGVGTHDLLAYSLDPGPPVTVNAFREDSFLGPPPTAAIRFGDQIVVGPFFPFFDRRVFAPPIGFRDRAKPAAAQFVRSGSPAAAGPAVGFASYIPPAGPVAAGILARALAPGAGQQAAAEAIDPITLPPGSYAYAPTITEATLHLDGLPDEFAGVTFFADDSRFSDPLWILSIVATGALTSPSDLLIEFRSQPLLGLDDADVASQVRSNFAVGGGTATLASYTLFSTTYEVTETIQFAEGVNGGVASAVPGPATFVLAVLGAVGLGVARVGRGQSRRRDPVHRAGSNRA